jgi:2-C-methyl-D-erythritol 4-phosphate cytidylyltransferase
MNIAIILAAGMGKRMNAGKNKVFLSLGKKPIIFYTISAFEKNSDIKKIVIVTKEEEIAYFQKLSKKYKFNKIKAVIGGGKERQDSAYNALKYLKKESGRNKKSVVVFHNGANPFVTKLEISQSIKEAKKYGACAIAHPTKDTVKEVDKKGLVIRTLERKKLWNMQTPQTISFDLALEAFSKAYEDDFLGTDDVSLVERLGKKVRVIEGSPNNFKITTPLDIELAKIIMQKYEF